MFVSEAQGRVKQHFLLKETIYEASSDSAAVSFKERLEGATH